MTSTGVGKKMEATSFSEVSVISHVTVQHYIPEDTNLSCDIHGNLKFCIVTSKFSEFETKR